MDRFHQLNENLWVIRYPLRLLGTSIGRNVTIIRFVSGQVLIHSTAPFSAEDRKDIEVLGKPAWLVDATIFHDTFAREGVSVFPDLPYFAPAGFAKKVPHHELKEGSHFGSSEVEVLKLEGMPWVNEHPFFHAPSKTLVIADLLFNWGPASTEWENFVRKNLMGISAFPGMSRFFCLSIRDREKFERSIHKMLLWDFDRVVVAHGEVIEKGARSVVIDALGRAGFRCT